LWSRGIFGGGCGGKEKLGTFGKIVCRVLRGAGKIKEASGIMGLFCNRG
jgi:hypothetical protein